MMLFLYLVVLILFPFAFSEILVNLPNGVIRGKQSKTYTNTTFFSFEKIPYASPPIGQLRFKAPVPPKNWNGVLDTTQNHIICYQVASDLPIESEDCLYLNVYTPNLPNSDETTSYLPVLFYIHGGGFIGGACLDSICGPEFLIDYQIVVVTINYRLGPFGFLSTQDNEIPGNNGLKDQQFALKWTHDNIMLFGGDPSRVTIVGQSAGSASVTYQMLNKNSEGLFWAAICQSGSFLSPWSFQRKPKEIAFQTASFINENFKNSNDSKALHEFLLSVTADELDKASYKVHQTETFKNRQMSQGFFYAPVLESEHKDAFMTRRMYNDLKSGIFLKVPTIIGINSEESLEDANDLNLLNAYQNDPKLLIPDGLNLTDPEKRKIVGEFIQSLYSSSKLDLSAVIRYSSDNSFTRSIIKHAELQSKFTDVYFYQFSYDGLIGNVSVLIKGAEKISHTEELRYMWQIDFQGYNNTNIAEFPESDVITHKRLLTMWTNFAKTRKPITEKSQLFENIEWPTVASKLPKEFVFLDINKNLTIKNYPKIGTFLAWNMIFDIFGDGECVTF